MKRILWIGGREVTPADCRKIGCDYDTPLFRSTQQKKFWFIKTTRSNGKWHGCFNEHGQDRTHGNYYYKARIEGGYRPAVSNLFKKDPNRLP